MTGAAQVPGVVSSQARAIALLCMVVTFGSGIGTSSDFLHLVGGVPSPIELPHGSPVAERWAQLIKLGNKAAELTYKAAEPERDFLSVLLVVLAVALSFTFVCALRVLRPGGLPREGVRKLLSASALFTAVLRTIEGAVQSALSLRVARAMSSLIGQPGWDDSGSLAVRPYLGTAWWVHRCFSRWRWPGACSWWRSTSARHGCASGQQCRTGPRTERPGALGGTMRASTDEAALRVVIVYKWVKGGFQLLLAAALTLTLLLGFGDELQGWAHEFRTHATRAYATVLSRALETLTSTRGMHVTVAALWVDGLVTSFEGWALNERHPWGAWLVVVVSGSLLPFEVVFLARHFTWQRLLVLVVNLAVVVFLFFHAREQSRHLRESRGSGENPPPPTTPPPATATQ